MTLDGAGSDDQELAWVRKRRDDADYWSLNQWKNAGRWRQMAFWGGVGSAVVAVATFLFAALSVSKESDALLISTAISGAISAGVATLLSALNPSQRVGDSDRIAKDNANIRDDADLLMAQWDGLTPQQRDERMRELGRKVAAARSRG